MKAHKTDMLAAWAKENGIEGYEHYDPKWREKHRMRMMKSQRKQEDKKSNFK